MSDTPHPRTVFFARGTLARLALWPALRLAVHESWGGPNSIEKQRWLASILVDQFEPFITTTTTTTVPVPSSSSFSPPSRTPQPGSLGHGNIPSDDYIEELLLQIMVDEFDVVLEDGSAAAVARDIVKLFGEVCVGDETFVEQLETQAERVKGKMPKYEMGVGSGSESGSEWEDEDEDDGGEESDRERVLQLLNQSEPQTQVEPRVDEEGFTMVKKKGRR